MTTTRAKACGTLNGGDHDEQTHPLRRLHVTSLPEPLLERIMISGTSTWDKKVLRVNCRYFQRVLDKSLVCVEMITGKDGTQQDQESFLKRLEQLPNLRSMTLVDWQRKSHSLFTYLPSQLTMLDFHISNIDVKELARLPCLTALYMNGSSVKVTGMSHISGLTNLHCDKPVGSLTHLAPTLKRLSIWIYDNVEGMDQLTNLEVLSVTIGMPTNFFQTHRQLPLKQVSIGPYHDSSFFESRALWQSAPPTLTCLTWVGNRKVLQDVLPVSITRLQLVYAASAGFEAATAALPWPRRLDLLDHASYHYSSTYITLTKFTGLQTLCMCMEDDGYAYWNHQKVLSRLPGVAMVVERDVKLEMITTQSESANVFLEVQTVVKTAWATSGS